jgi:spore maturation protein SpmA
MLLLLLLAKGVNDAETPMQLKAMELLHSFFPSSSSQGSQTTEYFLYHSDFCVPDPCHHHNHVLAVQP